MTGLRHAPEYSPAEAGRIVRSSDRGGGQLGRMAAAIPLAPKADFGMGPAKESKDRFNPNDTAAPQHRFEMFSHRNGSIR